MRHKLAYREREFQVTLIDESPFIIRIRENGQDENVELVLKEHRSEGRVLVNNRMLPYFVTHESDAIWVTLDGYTYVLERMQGERDDSAAHGGFKAPMPGKVLDVLVSAGSRVVKDDVLIVMEAMKMEHRMEAPADGVVVAVHVKKGELVAQGFQLLEFAED
ncbi:MAG: hypothetical protein CR997_03815 [Acidobacteria bacterium]|nr:MAG: hypothetical protein CR997_03815 [Acidobacteriota bacterium]